MPLVFDWKELSSRKAFFDEFARDNNFDPLVSGNWYDVTYDDILGKKVCSVSPQLDDLCFLGRTRCYQSLRRP